MSPVRPAFAAALAALLLLLLPAGAVRRLECSRARAQSTSLPTLVRAGHAVQPDAGAEAPRCQSPPLAEPPLAPHLYRLLATRVLTMTAPSPIVRLPRPPPLPPPQELLSFLSFTELKPE